ncbi:MAG: O-antigen ligase family protein [Thermaceae bacterium]|nr:O-antigen ligase family protein [Thermaceae bacterium]
MQRWLALPFALLPLQPAWFGGLAALVGLWVLLRGKRPLLWKAFLAMGLLGALGQLLTPASIYSPPERPSFLGSPPKTTPPSNLIRPYDLKTLHGWNPKDFAGGQAKPVEQGFWYLPRHNPISGHEQTEFLTDWWYPLKAGQTYTQSFYLRHDGQRANLQITFFTNQGHHPVPTQIEPVAPGVYRVWGSYTAKEGDGSLRAIDFLNQGGDFTYLEVGWPQLEIGSTPTPYQLGPTGLKPLDWRLWWWIGTTLMGFLMVQAGVWIFQQISPTHAALAVLAGLLVHLGYAGWQWLEAGPGARVMGFTPQPNFLGHGAVMAAGLIWVLGGRRLGGVALGVAALLLWISGSRTAFWAWLLLGAAWGWSLGRRRWVALGLAGLLGAVALFEPEWLGRFSQALSLDHNAQARLQFWQVALQAFRENPLGGVGFGNFTPYFNLYSPKNTIEYSPPHAHNLLLNLLAEGGALALLGVGVWLAGIVHLIVRTRAWPVLILLGVALVLNSFDFTFFSAWVYYPLLLAVAHAIAGAQDQPASAKMRR